MTTYVAIINTPGYLPDSDSPSPVFDTAGEAWEYLLEERRLLEEVADTPPTSTHDWPREGVGTVTSTTPGYEGDHDLGLAYSVAVAP